MEDQQDPPGKKGLWLAIPALAALGGVKFCAKKAPRMADDVLRNGSHLVDDAADGVLDGARRNLPSADGVTEPGALTEFARDATLEGGLQMGADAALGDDDR